VSGKHNVPAIRSSFFSAKAACEAAGKQLCTEAQWIAACQGAAPIDDNGNGQVADDLIEGTAYPYGDFHEPGRCWEAKINPKLEPGQAPPFRPVYTGEMPACVSPAGVYDLTGNMEEWVGTSPENAVLLGGAFDTPDDKARCYRRNDTFGAGYANVRTGFRCCKGL
jgi:formylglycine-generating enzyme required for sulfatase activity